MMNRIKRILCAFFAVMLISMSVVPAFALDSPQGELKYEVTVIPNEGGTGDYGFRSEIDENGDQLVEIWALPNDEYTFNHWVIEGEYKTDDKFTDSDMNLVIESDITIEAIYDPASGDTVSQPTTVPVVKDTSPVSPKTGGSDGTVLYTVMFLLIAACGVGIAGLVRYNYKSK